MAASLDLTIIKRSDLKINITPYYDIDLSIYDPLFEIEIDGNTYDLSDYAQVANNTIIIDVPYLIVKSLPTKRGMYAIIIKDEQNDQVVLVYGRTVFAGI
jgi:hypothetical protein